MLRSSARYSANFVLKLVEETRLLGETEAWKEQGQRVGVFLSGLGRLLSLPGKGDRRFVGVGHHRPVAGVRGFEELDEQIAGQPTRLHHPLERGIPMAGSSGEEDDGERNGAAHGTSK